jgi:cytochrome c
MAGLAFLPPATPRWIAPRSRQLVKAVRANDLMLTATLLETGADPNARNLEGVSVLGMALRNDALGMAKLLIDRGADVNLPVQGEITPLALATERGQPQVVELLLDAGAVATVSEATYATR